MLEFLLAAYLTSVLVGPSSIWTPHATPAAIQGVIGLEDAKIATCKARAQGVADALSAAKTGEWGPLEQAGIAVDPPALSATGCSLAVVKDVRTIDDFDGIAKISGVGPTRYSVVWKANS